MPRAGVITAVACLCLTGLAATCPSTPREISRERAIEIARPQATFEVVSIEAVRTTEDGRPAWQVTMQGPASPAMPALRPTVIVYIDRQSGDIISIAKS